MSAMTLVPAVYRCPDHDNQQAVTARVYELVGIERTIHADRASGAFRVTVTCPGHPSDAGTAHRRAYEGTWRAAVPTPV